MGDNVPLPAPTGDDSVPAAQTPAPAAPAPVYSSPVAPARARSAGPVPTVPFVARPVPVTDRFGLGLLTAVVAAAVAAGIYATVVGATSHDYGWVAIAVGYLVGISSGKVGGKNTLLAVAAVLLSLLAVYFGEMLGIALLVAKDGGLSATDMFFHHFGALNTGWRKEAGLTTCLFYLLAGATALSGFARATR